MDILAATSSIVSIRSRRLSAGECCRGAESDGGEGFQSAPADCRRENAAFSDVLYGRFNPLPPTVGGRISCDCLGRAGRFNPLPPTVGGRIERAIGDAERDLFQSAPADCRREDRGTSICAVPATFQSAPADCRRENGGSGATRPMRFQSAPADCRRENAWPPFDAGHDGGRFNPLPPTVGGRM